MKIENYGLVKHQNNGAGDDEVVMSNALTRASHGLSFAEKRVIAFALSQIETQTPEEFAAATNGGWRVRLNAVDFVDMLGVSRQVAYEQLKAVGETLIKKQWRIGDKKAGSVFNWLSMYKYHEKQGYLEMDFTKYTAPHVLNLKARGQFTVYQLKHGAALRSVYSWRLFECLMSWRSTGRWIVQIEDFLDAMDAPPSLRKNFSEVERRIIKPAMHELVSVEGMDIKLTKRKLGRKVDTLIFDFKMNKQGMLL
jgi:plasmid replication initiation protein